MGRDGGLTRRRKEVSKLLVVEDGAEMITHTHREIVAFTPVGYPKAARATRAVSSGTR